MTSTLSRCIHLHPTKCRQHALIASAASYFSSSSSSSPPFGLSSGVGVGRARAPGLAAGLRTRKLRMAMALFHSTPVGMYASRDKKSSSSPKSSVNPKSKLKFPSKKPKLKFPPKSSSKNNKSKSASSSKLAPLSAVRTSVHDGKTDRNRYPQERGQGRGKAEAPREGTNVFDELGAGVGGWRLEQGPGGRDTGRDGRRDTGRGGGRYGDGGRDGRGEYNDKPQSYKSRSRMYARENEKQEARGPRRGDYEYQRGGDRDGRNASSKYFEPEPARAPIRRSPSLSSSAPRSASASRSGSTTGPRVTAVLDSTKQALSSSTTSKSNSKFARDEAPHVDFSHVPNPNRGATPRDSRVLRSGGGGEVPLRRRGWDAVGRGAAVTVGAKYNDRPLFDPEGTFRGTEEIFFDRSPYSHPSSHSSHSSAESNAPDTVSSAIRDALARSEERVAGAPIGERMPFRHKVQIERGVLRALEVAGPSSGSGPYSGRGPYSGSGSGVSGAAGNGGGGWGEREVYAYRQRKADDDLGFVLGEVEDAKRRASNGAGSSNNTSHSNPWAADVDEDANGVGMDAYTHNEIILEGIDESLERGHDGGEFFRPAKLVQAVGDTGVSLPGSSTKPNPKNSKDAQSKEAAADGPQLQRYLDKEMRDTPKDFEGAHGLMNGFKRALGEMFGRGRKQEEEDGLLARGAKPTPIQALSLRWIVGPQVPPPLTRAADVEEDCGQNIDVPSSSNALVPYSHTNTQKWRQYLLAAETGSGKSIAYLLPVLQSLKLSEAAFLRRVKREKQIEESTAKARARANKRREKRKGKGGKGEREVDPEEETLMAKKKTYEHNPRALILAPTHELARQLAGFAKDLVHYPDTKLRVMCASKENVDSSPSSSPSSPSPSSFSSKEKEREVVFDNEHEFATGSDVDGPGEVHSVAYKRRMGLVGGMRSGHAGTVNPVDVLVGTPMKVLEMVYGRGWDRVDPKDMEHNELEQEKDEEGGDREKKLRRGRDKMVHFGTWKHRSELGLENVEWIVVDEADVLFDPDFEETTRMLLDAVKKAKEDALEVSSPAITSLTDASTTVTETGTTPPTYPFNLLLTSATIPTPLNAYLEKNHPSMLRLASPRLHKLPKTVQTEYVGWTGGNKFADVMRRARRVWAEDWGRRGVDGDVGEAEGSKVDAEERLSKILIFCNKSTKVLEMSRYFEEQGIPNVPVTSKSEHRGRGSNRHLDGFLRKKVKTKSTKVPKDDVSSTTSIAQKDKTPPRILITTSLLSRGLDFSPEIKHVFIIDEPRNMIDFLHRAGRVGRAGERGTVVMFGKMKGRGSLRGKEVRRKVGGMI